jgi:hypothetical protein
LVDGEVRERLDAFQCRSYFRLLVLGVNVVVTSLARGEAREDYRGEFLALGQ